MPNVDTKLITVVQAYNLGNIVEIMKYARDYYGASRLPDFIFLQSPEFLAPSALDEKKLQKYINEIIEELIHYEQNDPSVLSFKKYLGHLKSNKQHILDFAMFNKKLEQDEPLKWKDIENVI